MGKKQQYRYQAWKAQPNCDPIEGTDRILTGTSKRAILRHLAYEEGVEYEHSGIRVKCKDGTMWFVSKLSPSGEPFGNEATDSTSPTFITSYN